MFKDAVGTFYTGGNLYTKVIVSLDSKVYEFVPYRKISLAKVVDQV